MFNFLYIRIQVCIFALRASPYSMVISACLRMLAADIPAIRPAVIRRNYIVY